MSGCVTSPSEDFKIQEQKRARVSRGVPASDISARRRRADKMAGFCYSDAAEAGWGHDTSHLFKPVPWLLRSLSFIYLGSGLMTSEAVLHLAS